MIDKEQKYFADPQGGKLNSDDSVFALGANEWCNFENGRTGTTDGGVTAVVESIGSTRMVSAIQPSVTFMWLGGVEDTENGRVLNFYFDKVGTNHKIECFYSNGEVTYTVLRSDDVIGGLNFSKDFPIHSAKIANGLLAWPESTNNQPRCINIESGIKAYNPSFNTKAVPLELPIAFSEITLIKPPPPLAPNISKGYDGAFLNNFIENDSFQFVFQYVWYDNQTTVVGTYSNSSRLNKPGDNAGLGFNFISIVMDFDERIPSGVRIVNLIVRYDSQVDGKPTNNAKVIKVWDKNVPSEASLIAMQNAGTFALNFSYYNNIDGIPIAPDDVLRPFDNVPIYSETLEQAKSRNFLGNNTEGYDTPQTTSLSATLITTGIAAGASLTKNYISIKQRRYYGPITHDWVYEGWYVFLTEISPQGYYAITSTEVTVLGDNHYFPQPPPPAIVAFSGLTFRGADLNAVLAATVPPTYGPRTRYDYLANINTIQITGTGVVTYDVFKSKSIYNYGIVFYDFALRKCGVVTNSGLIANIPSRNFAYSTGVNGIVWQLSNDNAINEIPDWAYYYAVVRTLNQLTRFFVDSFTDAAKYAQKNSDGVYTFTSNTYVTGALGIGLNTTALYQSGLGYIFTEGDVCVLTKQDNTQYVLPVLGQDGNYIIVKAGNIGSLENIKFVYEIYTPYKTSTQEPYFEIGEMYKVINPSRDDRAYETLGDTFLPDAYVLSRNYTASTYFAEAMCPNDAYFQRWDTDNGKANFITKLGQVKKTTSISFSDTFIPNTAVNGLSTFRGLNQKTVPEDCGGITKLQLTSKVESQGTVMLAICIVESNSIYLGETQITDSTGQTQFFSSSDSVIGTINILKGNYGCVDATSVVQYRGNVYYLDANNGRWVQYSINGLDAISNYKMVRFWKLWSALYISMSKSQIEGLGDRPFVFATVDSSHDELLISIPKLSNIPPKGFLPDYPETVYPFDILDYRGKTIVYKIGQATILPHWQGSFSFSHCEGFVTLQNKLYSFAFGNMYQHNQLDSQNNFYGTQYTTKIMFPSNAAPQFPKQYDNIFSESNIVPKFVYFYSAYPIQQSSDLVDSSFRDYEGIWKAWILRNKLVPTAIGYNTDGLLTGERMRNTNLLIMIEFEPIATPLELRFITIGFSLSKGAKLTNP